MDEEHDRYRWRLGTSARWHDNIESQTVLGKPVGEFKGQELRTSWPISGGIYNCTILGVPGLWRCKPQIPNGRFGITYTKILSKAIDGGIAEVIATRCCSESYGLS
jgi:hypothetical protein